MANTADGTAPGTQAQGERAGTSRRGAGQRVTENAIRPAPRRRAQRSSARTSPRAKRVLQVREHGTDQVAGGSANEPVPAMPEEVRRHFVQVENRFYFRDGELAFTDRRNKLTTRSENTQLIADLVSVAQARGWERIAVSGTERFRREAWMAAQREGLTVSGYEPSKFDQAQWVRNLGQATPDAHAQGNDGPDPKTQRRAGRAEGESRVISGRLVDHGAAPYQHDPHEAMSYFVHIDTGRGERTVWGVDLQRALRESLSHPKVGDEVVLRAVGRDAVTVRRPAAGEEGVAEKATHRNRWSIESQSFLQNRERIAQVLRDASIPAMQGVREQPELVGAYMQVRAAELAAQQFKERSDRERFVSMVRTALADAVARGESLPKTQLRTPAGQQRAGERSRMDRER